MLLLESKPDKALQIYEYGLKVLPSGHPRRGVRPATVSKGRRDRHANVCTADGATAQET